MTTDIFTQASTAGALKTNVFGDSYLYNLSRGSFDRVSAQARYLMLNSANRYCKKTPLTSSSGLTQAFCPNMFNNKVFLLVHVSFLLNPTIFWKNYSNIGYLTICPRKLFALQLRNGKIMPTPSK